MGSENLTGADNQQRSLESRLCWLGGIIDGEGMITAIKRFEAGRIQHGFTPRISITNTDPKMIEEIASIFEELSLPYYIQTKAGKHGWKMKYEVLVGGFSRCTKVLPFLIPYLVVKRRKAEMLLEFCEKRQQCSRNSAYTKEHVELALSLRNRP